MRSAIDEFVTTKQENPFATLRQIENKQKQGSTCYYLSPRPKEP